MKKFLLSLAALSVLCATPVLAADVSPTPAVCSAAAAVSAAPVAPNLPADLFTPAPTDRGLIGALHHYRQLPLPLWHRAGLLLRPAALCRRGRRVLR